MLGRTCLLRQMLCFCHMRWACCLAVASLVSYMTLAVASDSRDPSVTLEPSCAFAMEHPGINLFLKSVLKRYVPGRRVWCVAVPSFRPVRGIVCGELRETPQQTRRFGVTSICFKGSRNSIYDGSLTRECTLSEDTWLSVRNAFTSVISRAHFEFESTSGLDGSMYYFFTETRGGRLLIAEKWSPWSGPPALLVEITGMLDASCTAGTPSQNIMSTNIQRRSSMVVQWDYEESHRQYEESRRQDQEHLDEVGPTIAEMLIAEDAKKSDERKTGSPKEKKRGHL